MKTNSNQNPLDLGGLVLKPGDRDYPVYAKLWNNRYTSLLPKIINVVEEVDHIKKALIYAKLNKMDLRIKSGGHNYEGFSMVDNGFVLNLSKMKHLEINTGNNTCTFGPGWLQDDLYQELKKRNVVISGGVCPVVSVVPVVLGGGTGIYHRKYGLTCDTIVSLKIMMHDGSILECNERQHQDLFWACRGAGNGNFGVVVSVTVKTFPALEVTCFKITWDWNDDVPVNWQRWLVGASKEVSSVSLDFGNYGSRGKPKVIISGGMCIGNQQTCERLIKSLLEMKPVPTSVSYKCESALEAGNLACGTSKSDPERLWSMEAALLSLGTEQSDRWKSTGLLSNQLLNSKSISEMGQLMDLLPEGIPGFAVSFVGLGGQVKERNEKDTAYPHRKSDFMMRIVAKWQSPEIDSIALAFHLRMKNLLAGATRSEAYYFNYSDLDVKNYLSSYFQVNQARLKEVKNRYDINGFFNYPQGIPKS